MEPKRRLLSEGDTYTCPHQLLGIPHLSGPGCLIYPPRWENCNRCVKIAPSYVDSVPIDLPTRGFKCLKVLKLRNVDVDGQIVEYFLSNCPYPERLSVESATNLVHLIVAAPSEPSLRYLAVKLCIGVASITICNSQLGSFIYKGGSINLKIDNVPDLVEVCLHQNDLVTSDFAALAFKQLSSHLFQLRTLMLDIEFYKSLFDDVPYPNLPNLEHLELIIPVDTWGLHRLAAFLRSGVSTLEETCAPGLCSSNLNWLRNCLLVQLQFSPYKQELFEDVPQCPHLHLKALEVVGYRTSGLAIELIMFIIENAAALEEVVIDPLRRWLHLRRVVYRSLTVIKEEKEAREHAMLQLKERIPQSIKFVCL